MFCSVYILLNFTFLSVVVSFLLLGPNAQENSFREERFILAHDFRRSCSLWSVSCIALGLWWGKSITAEGCGGGTLLILWHPEAMWEGRTEQKGPGTRSSPQGHTLLFYFFPFSFHHIPVISSNYDLINRATCWQVSTLITFWKSHLWARGTTGGHLDLYHSTEQLV